MKNMCKGKAILVAVVAGYGLLAGVLPSYGAVYVSEAPYDWEGNADSGEAYDSPRAMENNTGPGASQDPDNQDMASGPSVTQVTLAEQYHDDYKIYEESINNLFFFYANVANGGITDQNVTLDIPQNMFCTVEKDGAEYDYQPGQSFHEYGTYVVRVTAVEDTSVPFSEQKEYRALFRFRIQSKPPQEDGKTEGQEFLGPLVNDGFGMSSQWQESGIWPDGSPLETGEEGIGAGESQQESQESTPESLELSESSAWEETDGTEEDRQESQEDPEGTNAQEREGASLTSPGAYNKRIQVYDQTRGRYDVTFENGRTLTSNVPEGYIGPSTVELLVSEGEGSLYLDDEPLEYTENMSLKEPGYYRLDIDGQMWSFAILSAVGSIDYYAAPKGLEFTSLYFDGEPGNLPEGTYLSMKEDGQYQISMAGEEGDVLEVVLRKDTQPPRFIVNVKGGTAQIQYESDDIQEVILEKNGEVQEGFSGYTINSPGSYRLTAIDEAGNASSSEFSLKYQVNMYGIVAVVLVILLIAGGILFVFHVKRTVKIR